MAYIYHDRSYTPCSFLIVADGANPHNATKFTLVQTDWDYPGIAQSMGWSLRDVQADGQSCRHDGTDGTVKCPDCGIDAVDFIAAASKYIYDHAGETFDGLDEYLPTGFSRALTD